MDRRLPHRAPSEEGLPSTSIERYATRETKARINVHLRVFPAQRDQEDQTPSVDACRKRRTYAPWPRQTPSALECAPVGPGARAADVKRSTAPRLHPCASDPVRAYRTRPPAPP
ncbi:hypothetical protein B0H13DRAFT_2347369 [Mycena leptocephala]|nr:hypothetical protein B0H13DRAFT_2347369 [Mycena leptocephala]